VRFQAKSEETKQTQKIQMCKVYLFFMSEKKKSVNSCCLLYCLTRTKYIELIECYIEILR